MSRVALPGPHVLSPNATPGIRAQKKKKNNAAAAAAAAPPPRLQPDACILHPASARQHIGIKSAPTRKSPLTTHHNSQALNTRPPLSQSVAPVHYVVELG